MVGTHTYLHYAPRVGFGIAAAILAAWPAAWLISSWREDASGAAFFALAAVLFAWSATSPLEREPRAHPHRAVSLLIASALVRVSSEYLAINMLGAFVLVVDVYALGLLLNLDRRAHAVSPFWLASAFLFALPIERVVERLAGYAMQEASAAGACGLLTALRDDVECHGVRLTVHGADVLVDVPCSGSGALVLFGFAFAAAAALARPNLFTAATGAAIAVGAAWVANVVRITALSLGIAAGPDGLGVDVLAEPWHALIGALALLLTAPALGLWLGWAWPQTSRSHRSARAANRASSPVEGPFWARSALAAGACAVALAIVLAVPHRPLDIAARDIEVALPSHLIGRGAAEVPVHRAEEAYYAQYGGAVAKAGYGPFALLLARTDSPLRHIHKPEICLRNSGFEVTYLGLRMSPAPTSTYRADAPDGRSYRVETTFVGDAGVVTANVSRAVWAWLSGDRQVWTTVQRVTPWEASPADVAQFEAAVFASLDVPLAQAPPLPKQDWSVR